MHMQAEQAFETRGQLGRQHRGAGAAVLDGRDVGAAQWHVGQRGQYGRHRRQGRGPVSLDQAPVVGQHVLVAQQRRRRDDDFHPRRQRGQRRWQHTRNVKQRVAVDGDVRAFQPLQLHAGPGGEHLGAVAVARQLGCARGAARVKVGRNVFRRDLAAADEVVRRLLRAQRGEVGHAIRQGRRASWRLVVRGHAQQRGQGGHLPAQPQRLGPHARLRV